MSTNLVQFYVILNHKLEVTIANGKFVADCGRICRTTGNQGVKVHFLKAFHNVVFNAKIIRTYIYSGGMSP